MVVITMLPGDDSAAPRPKLTFQANGGLHGTTADASIDAALIAAADESLLRGTSRIVDIGADRYFLETFAVKPRVVIVGAVEIARSLVKLARELGYETIVIDGRAAFATRERFPDADELLVGWFDEVARDIGLSSDDSVVVLTHDMKFDEPAITTALLHGCRYVGAIGSRKTQAERRARLLGAGLSAGDLDRLHGPIGLDLGGRAPAETALAILAEIVASRYDATGAPLRDRTISVAAAPTG
jgi:xanthine dehydrogenase accessory factor